MDVVILWYPIFISSGDIPKSDSLNYTRLYWKLKLLSHPFSWPWKLIADLIKVFVFKYPNHCSSKRGVTFVGRGILTGSISRQLTFAWNDLCYWQPGVGCPPPLNYFLYFSFQIRHFPTLQKKDKPCSQQSAHLPCLGGTVFRSLNKASFWNPPGLQVLRKWKDSVTKKQVLWLWGSIAISRSGAAWRRAYSISSGRQGCPPSPAPPHPINH